MKLKVFVDVTVFMEGQNNELPGIAEKVLRSLKTDAEENGLRLSWKEGREGREGRAR